MQLQQAEQMSTQFMCRGRMLDLDRVVLMGVLNVTPDSFSDGGLWLDPDAAVAHGRAMASAGAAIVDVGGESTRPGAEPVSEAEELRRVIPVVERLAAEVDVVISIDTRKVAVAAAALEAGASLINDTMGEETDGGLDKLAAETGAGICIMHSRGSPATMRDRADYDDVVSSVAGWLATRVDAALAAGISRTSIAIDPGIGFAKTPAQNFELLNRLDELTAIGPPVLVGTSRKSFIGAVLDLPEPERVEGTIATVCWAVARGARIVRVHDVEPVRRAVRTLEAIIAAGGSD